MSKDGGLVQKKRLMINTVSSMILQITTIICGLIIPRLILRAFGSEINGLVNSITQFLGLISFMELGVGAVVETSLYKPLAEHDMEELSKVMTSARRFFRTIARILFVYVSILFFLYPVIVKNNFNWLYSSSLVLILSITAFMQYYFGIVNKLLLNSDQKGYIQYILHTVCLVLNALTCFVLIKIGCTIHIVRLASAVVFLIQPITMYAYVNKHYNIDYSIQYTEEPIKQKWNGIAQHVSQIVLDGTDTIVLTIFATLKDVSIYHVYYVVVHGVRTLTQSLSSGIQPLIGHLWAKKETEDLLRAFRRFEWIVHTVTTYAYSCIAALIVSFVTIYTSGVNDADYYRPAFALILSLANCMRCLRLPYNVMVLAAGHYKQTQASYIIAAALNLVISIIVVSFWGLIGVAVGTLIAMSFQTLWLAWYTSRHLIEWPLKNVLKHFIVDALLFCITLLIGNLFELSDISFVGFLILAVKVAVLALVPTLGINFLLYRDDTVACARLILSRFTSVKNTR